MRCIGVREEEEEKKVSLPSAQPGIYTGDDFYFVLFNKAAAKGDTSRVYVLQ